MLTRFPTLSLTALGAALALLLASCNEQPQPLQPPELLRSAWSHFRLDEYSQAAADFQAARERLTPADPLRLNATYGLALLASLTQPEDPARYRALLQEVIAEDTTPPHSLAAWSALALARADNAANPPALAQACIHIFETYPDTAAGEEALLQRTLLQVDTYQPEDARAAIAAATSFLSTHPNALYRSQFLALVSTAHYTLQQFPQALQAAIDSLNAKEIDPANPRQNNILEYYRIAVMAEFDVGDFATARTYYHRFLTEYPNDQRVFDVQLLLKHLNETEARLQTNLPPTQLSALALPQETPPQKEAP